MAEREFVGPVTLPESDGREQAPVTRRLVGELLANYTPSLPPTLAEIAALRPPDGALLRRVAGAWSTATIADIKGALALTRADVGLDDIDNTADLDKPVSTAQQAALNTKAPLASPAFTGTPTGITKAHVGLGNVDNTADSAKPVSTAQQAALDAKVPTARTITAGTGLTGGGDLSANRSLAVAFGTAAGTAAQGNDPRLSDPRTPTAHTHDIADLTATGTRDATTFLRGDGTWAAPSATPSSKPVSGGDDWDTRVYGDIVSNGPRDDVTATWAFASARATLVMVLGWLPAGSAITGLRLFRTTAMVGGAASAALYTAATIAAPAWARIGSAVTPTLTATGLLAVPYAFTQGADGFVALQLTLTTLPTTYPVLAATPAGQVGLLTGPAAVAGISTATTAPPVVLNPTSGWTQQTQKPWAALY